MAFDSWKPFLHPGGVYRLEYPSHWEHVNKDEGRSCGFGPYDRDDVGLWISILPMSVDTDRLTADLPNFLKQAMPQMDAGEFERDMTIKQFAMKAKINKEGEGGSYWLIAAGDVVLFASTQVPETETEIWNPPFERVMSSLRVTRDDELFFRKLAGEVLERLRKKDPEEEFELDEKGIRGKHQLVYLSNLMREIKEAPERREKIISHFVNSLAKTKDLDMGYETWEEAQARMVPVIKPKEYFKTEGPTSHQLKIDWLPDVAICYALRAKNLIRFVTGWDVNRWGTDNDTVHKVALENLRRLPWPKRLEGCSSPGGGRVIVVQTTDSLTSSRLLHPDLHKLFKDALGTPFCAGVPDRDTLVLFSNRKQLKQKISRRLTRDHHGSPYPITPRPFLVTADGIALA